MQSGECAKVSIERQIKAAKRELALRRNTYRRLVDAKRMNKFDAEDEIAAMKAIVETLEELQRSKPRA